MILIGADFVPTASNEELFRSGDARALFGDALTELLQCADYRIFNLETPLCDTLHPIPKWGKNFSAPAETIRGYSAAHADLLALANNHIMDQGPEGLSDTFDVLRANGIPFVGAGQNLREAARPFCFSDHGKKIGVYACAEHEFSIAEADRAGANPFDPLESPDHVKALKEACDYVIVLYHGGKEYYRYPSPLLQKTCRKLIDKGADLVVCQHSHCIGCEEQYGGGTIVYGQGNFLFDNSEHEMWQTGLLVRVDENGAIDYVPFVKNGNTVRMASQAQRSEILGDFRQRSMEIRQEGFVSAHYAQFAGKMVQKYFIAAGGKRTLLTRLLNRLTGNKLMQLRLRRRYGSEEQLMLQNYLECEAHRELFLEGIREKRRQKQ